MGLCWAVKKTQEHRMQVKEMSMLRHMSEVSRRDRTSNEYIRGRLGVVAIKDKRDERAPATVGFIT